MLSTRNTSLSTSSSSHSTHTIFFRYYSYSLMSRRNLIIILISTLLMFDAVLCQHPHKRQPRHGKSLCHQKRTGYYSHPRDPSRYVHCVKGNAYVYFCGEGTVFVSDKELCLPLSASTHKKHHRNKKAMIDDESELKFPKRRYNVILV